ncbi:phosphoenolpyruvate-utilizing N-terminal domain-containing protein [uncultured Brachyspira sp.]|uniref:phosphoenolpyruvate-utilizing N-terminal domain-containing protein n=1 Tax=uncultured Brachyspira sp. TaxID=221953 RepID=UPI002612BCD2|nr:phosphoenolpyruvate-utilizing N-terminal domain-containing protein [uncultured Brachyspira sp.]
MVGLIFVSDSHEFVIALQKYINKVGNVSAACSGGVGENNSFLGTNHNDIYKVINDNYTEDGIIIFFDSKEALVNCEMAVAMLDKEKQKNVRISFAPIVEGGMIAASEASLNKKIYEIEDKLNNLTKKCDNVQENLRDYIKKEYVVKLKNGFHVRPIFMFMNTISKNNCSVYITNKTKNKNIVCADSMSKISLLNIQNNDIVEVYIKGDNHQVLTEYFKDLFDGKFEFSDNEAKKVYTVNSDFEIVCEGKVSGLAKYVDLDIKIGYEEQRDIDIKTEKEKFVYAIETVRKEILKQKKKIEEKKLRNDESLIFDSHLSMLLDEAVINDVDSLLDTSKHTALYLYTNIMQNMYDCFNEFDDFYMVERKYDIQDILNQVLAVMLDKKIELPEKGDIILISDNIYVSNIANFSNNIKGVISLNGSSISHSAILLKALNIPYIVYKDAKKFDGKNIVIDTNNKDIIYLNN